MARREVIITRRPEPIFAPRPATGAAPVAAPEPAPVVMGIRPCGHPATKKSVCGVCKTDEHNRLQTAEALPRRDPPPLSRRRIGFRLPHGATIEATYNATTECWTASLRVGDETTQSTGKAIHPLIMWLGQRYAKAHAPVAVE